MILWSVICLAVYVAGFSAAIGVCVARDVRPSDGSTFMVAVWPLTVIGLIAYFAAKPRAKALGEQNTKTDGESA